MADRHRILFICTGNACRSQMAEGLMRDLAGDRFEVHSAGSHPAGYIHECAITAMDEIGIDIRGQSSKSVADYLDTPFDYVVTVCDFARGCIPTLVHAGKMLHWPMVDPVSVLDDDEKQAAVARKVRDELRKRLTDLVQQDAKRTAASSSP